MLGFGTYIQTTTPARFINRNYMRVSNALYDIVT